MSKKKKEVMGLPSMEGASEAAERVFKEEHKPKASSAFACVCSHHRSDHPNDGRCLCESNILANMGGVCDCPAFRGAA